MLVVGVVAAEGVVDTDLAAVAVAVRMFGEFVTEPLALIASFLPEIPASPGPATVAPFFAAGLPFSS